MDDRRSAELLEAIFSASPDAVVVIDDSGTIVMSSPAVTTLFGYSADELVGKSLDLLLPVAGTVRHAEHLQRYFAVPRARRMGAGRELSGRHLDEHEFPVDVGLAPVELDGRRLAVAFVREASERQRGLDRLHAANEITQRLLAGETVPGLLPLVAQRAKRLAQADAVWIVQRTANGPLEITAVDGARTEALLGSTLSAETSRSAQVMASGNTVIIEDLSNALNVPIGVPLLGLGPAIYVPMIADERRFGVLVLSRSRGKAQFETVDVALAEVFAGSIAAAIEMSEVRAELGRLEIVSEDERIARDLHDTVIQDLFAIGLSLQATLRSMSGPIAERIDTAIKRIDDVIREIRTTIFRLPGRTANANGLRDEMLRIAAKFSKELGFSPRIEFYGAVDTLVPDEVSTELLQVLGEALANVARHAGATSVEAVLSIEHGQLALSIADNGAGIATGRTAGHGLRNMAARAEQLDGTCLISNRETGGTVVLWQVPILDHV